MWFADLALTASVAVFLAVVLAWPLVRLADREGWSASAVRPVLRTGSVTAAALLLGQAVVVDAVADENGLHVADAPTLAWFVAHRTEALTAVAKALALLGGTVAMTVVATVTVVTLWLRGRRPQAVVVAVTAFGGGLLVAGFKHLYARDRPPMIDRLDTLTSHSLPSGHALGSTVVLGLLAAVLALHVRRRAARAGVIAAAVATVVAVGVSRLYLGVHWLTDVLTGWLLGGAWLAVAVTALVLLRSGGRGQPVRSRTSQTTVSPRS